MSKLPRNVKPQKLITALEKLGFVKYKGKGSHMRLKHKDRRWTQVAIHPGPIPQGTLRKILSQAGISIQDLEKYY